MGVGDYEVMRSLNTTAMYKTFQAFRNMRRRHLNITFFGFSCEKTGRKNKCNCFFVFFCSLIVLKDIHGKLQFIIVFRFTLTLWLLKQVIVALQLLCVPFSNMLLDEGS